MPHLFFSLPSFFTAGTGRRLHTWLGLSVLLAGPALAQPTITSSNPARNANAVSRTSNVAVTFSQVMGAPSSSALRVFSSVAGGRKAGPPASVVGALSDVDGDGDLDLLATSSAGSGAVSLCRNNGDGSFGASTETALPGIPAALVVADVDGDGDLDWVSTGVGVMGPVGMQLLVCVRLNQNATPLPVELTAFSAERQGNAARLRWATASEKNNAGFTVESSVDGGTFRKVTFVAGHQTSTLAHTYEFLDHALLNYGATGVVYYRMRQQDTNGPATFSPVRTVALSGQTSPATLTLYPNPGTAQTTRTLLGAPANVPAVLLDALGREVLRLTTDAAGSAQLLLPTQLAPGVYILRLPTQSVRVVVAEK